MKKQISPQVAAIVIAVIVIVAIVIVFAALKKPGPQQTGGAAERAAVGSPMKMMKGPGSVGKVRQVSEDQPSLSSSEGQPTSSEETKSSE